MQVVNIKDTPEARVKAVFLDNFEAAEIFKQAVAQKLEINLDDPNVYCAFVFGLPINFGKDFEAISIGIRFVEIKPNCENEGV